ncbi:MAG: thiamine diphosphokinase [Clostridia bacterium]|nr:thiamine diphosphokinase [Clostridia bacterium]
MKGILLLNGKPYTGKICAENARVLCCDGAYDWAKDRVRIDENVGDFDSLDYLPSPPPQEIYPAEKDFTDGEIALRKLIAYGCDEIEIYGGGGGREDHFLGNLHLLYYAHERKMKVKMLTENAEIYPASGKTALHGAVGKTVSLLPFGGNAHIISSEGLKYPLNDLRLSYGACRGISNVVLKNPASFVCGEGTVLVFLNRK